jgi:putative flippase GtrA
MTRLTTTNKQVETPLLAGQALRFLVAGLVNTGFGYIAYVFFLALSVPPVIALGMATAIGALFNYFSTGLFVFKHRTLDRLPRFLTAYTVIYAINALLLHWFVEQGFAPALVQIVLLPVVAIASFLVFRFGVFRRV